MDKVYTLARSRHTVAGHGDSYTSTVIERDGAYESGSFPPVFAYKDWAEQHRLQMKSPDSYTVVELEFVGLD